MNAVTTPNLKAFTTDLPKTRIGILRLLWPTIQACLEAGHSLRDVHEKLQLDGIEMAYSTLCWAVATIRHAGPPTAGRAQNSSVQAVPRRAGERTGGIPESGPLRNLRRLSENRPGFEYPGTLPDEKLFGPK